MIVPSFTSLGNLCQQIRWMAGSGALRLPKQDVWWYPNSRQYMHLPTGKWRVVSLLPDFWNPL